MNYRHIFHAGNICDVVKHAILTLCVEHLRLKEKGFFALDTHAGIGLYDLADERALKTNEAQSGIIRLLESPHISYLSSYYSVLQKLNPNWVPEDPRTIELITSYPGSPVLIDTMLRPQDRLVASELHPEDVVDLRRVFRQSKQTHIHHRDGYESLTAFLPPPEKRGLVLVDPPFEKPDEFEKLPQRIFEAHQRWPQGMFLVWYPIKERPTVWRFHEALIASKIPKQLCAEFIFAEETRHDRLNGSGCLIINPPWQFDEKLPLLFKALHLALKTTHQGLNVEWLIP